jgi:N-ethylmaleimide reductase
LAKVLSKKRIAFMEVAENFTFDATNDKLRDEFFAAKEHKNIRAFLKPHFNGVYIANAGYDYEKATTVVQAKEAELVSFGTHFICNNDLVERCKESTPLRNLGNVKDMSKLWNVYFYMGGAEGYTDLTPYEA